MNHSNDPLRDKTMLFAIRIVNLNRYLTKVKKGLVVSYQVTRSGTNPGAMVREAANAESGFDFVHKLGVAQKEIGETQYWLELLYQTHYLTQNQYISLFADSEEIMKLIRSSILTKKKNLAKKAVLLLIFLTTILLL